MGRKKDRLLKQGERNKLLQCKKEHEKLMKKLADERKTKSLRQYS